MKLRQKSKRDQALDAAASVAKTWSEWRLGEKVSKTATKASRKAAKSAAKASAKAKKSSKPSKPAARRKPLKIAGVIALVGGVGAAVAKKLGGGKAEPLYTPPGPASDTASPPEPPVAVQDLANATSSSPASTSVPSTDEPATTASTGSPPQDPSRVVVEDLVGEPAVNEPVGAGEPAAAAQEDRPGAETTPDPEDLVSDSADDEAAADGGESTDRPAG